MLRGLIATLGVVALLWGTGVRAQEGVAIDESDVLVPEGESEDVVAGWQPYRKLSAIEVLSEWAEINGGLIGKGGSPPVRASPVHVAIASAEFFSIIPKEYADAIQRDGDLPISLLEVRIDDARSGAEIRHLRGSFFGDAVLHLSSDGRLVVLGALRGQHQSIGLWEVGSGRLVQTQRETNAMVGLAFSPNGRRLLVGGDDGSVRAWDIVEGKQIHRVPGSTAIGSVAFSPDGLHAAVSVSPEGLVRIWEVETWVERGFFKGGPTNTYHSLAFSPDGRWLASGRFLNGEELARVHSLDTGQLVANLTSGSTNHSIAALAFSPDGRYLASGTLITPTVRIWSTSSWKELNILSGHKDSVNALAFNPDSSYVATGSSDRTVRLWEVGNWNQVRLFSGFQAAVLAVAISPDGQYLATGDRGGTIRVLDLSSGKIMWEQRADANDVAFSPDGRYLASSSGDGTVWLWHWRQGRAAARLFAGNGGWAFQRVGQRVYRHDDGDLLCHLSRDEKASCSPVLPAMPASLPVLDTSASVVIPPSEGLAVGRILVQVHNSGAGPAYWPRFSARDLPRGVILLPPKMPLRLNPGVSVTLPLEISSLSADSPGPRDVTLKLALRHAHGDGPTLTIPLHLRAPRLDIRKSSIQGDRRSASVQVVLRNGGDQDPGNLRFAARFLRDGKAYGEEVRQEAASLGPGATVTLAFPVPQELLAPRDFLRRFSLEITASGTIWPTHQWVLSTPPLRSVLFFYLLYGATLLISAALGLVALHFVRIYRDPVVLTLSRAPVCIMNFDLEELQRVTLALRRAHRLDSTLAAAALHQVLWDRALAASGVPAATARAFADAVGATLGAQLGVHPAWHIDLPTLRLRFAHKTAVAVCTGKTLEAGAATQLAMAIYDEGSGPSVALLLDRTESQRAAEAVRGVPHVSFVVVNRATLRDLLLSDQPAEVLEAVLAEQRPVVELSPYQVGGGVDDERVFFGREAELRAIADQRLHNVLLVGPRQMGKSSLLKALLRRVSARPDVEVYFLTLDSGDLAGPIADKLGAPVPDSPQAFRELARGTRERPRLWLIDEADPFVVADGQAGHGLTRAMRALAEEGLAYFVLAGFWQLYAAVALEPHHPLRNFGKTLRLGPLGRDAARELAVQPMASLRLFYDGPATVERLLDETGCRANLVAVACTGLIESLDAYTRTLTAAHLATVLRTYPRLRDELRYWRGAPALDRAVVRAALILGEAATVAEVQRCLAQKGVTLAGEALAASLDRLELGYLLVRDEQGRLSCPIPLLRRLIEREGDLEQGLEEDLALG